MAYLIDTDICIFFLRGKYDIDRRIEEVGKDNCFISEITLAELKYGAEKSASPEKHRSIVSDFEREFLTLPILPAIDIYAKEKARLASLGTPIDDFDLLIGATAIANSLILITNNERHFQRIEGISIANWTKQ